MNKNSVQFTVCSYQSEKRERRKPKILTLVLCLVVFPLSALAAEEITGKEILERIDKNYSSENRISISTMIIKGRRGTRTIKAKSYAQGQDKAFTEYLEPPREKGTKMLKLKDELWMYTPSADRVIRIAGHMLRQSMSGSDISYEDFMEDPNLANSYEADLTREDTIQGRACYVLNLKAKKDEVAYSARKLWVDKERFLPIREDLFAKGGKLLKTLRITEMFQIEKRWYPKRMNFKDVLKDGDGTELDIESIEFNSNMPEHIFTKAALRR